MGNKRLRRQDTNKGITLIALVITIIVMLILVAVTITMAVNGGLFEYAQNAGTQTNGAIANEQLLANGGVTIGDQYYNSIDEYLGTQNTVIDNGTYDETPKDAKGLLTKNATYKNGGYTATIPQGFKLLLEVEDEIAEGIVIQDANGNEYVWIPVEEGTFERTGWWENEPTDKTLEDITEELTLDEIKYYIARICGYSSMAEMMKKHGEKYGEGPFENYEDLLAWKGVEAETEEEVEEYTIEWFQERYWFAGALTEEEYIEDETTQEYTNMVNSVNTNGGFYIGRYEAGSNDSDRYTEIADETVLVQQGVHPYNFVAWGSSMTNTDTPIGRFGHGAVYLSRHMYDNQDVGVTSTLCYGVQWDAALRFIKNKVNVTNSAAWGNYSDCTFTFSGKYSDDGGESWKDNTTIKPQKSGWLLKTGASEQNKAKNIYDLAGNIAEWTMESLSLDSRVSRGGVCIVYGVDYPAANRDDFSPDYCSDVIGFRPALYITNE